MLTYYTTVFSFFFRTCLSQFPSAFIDYYEIRTDERLTVLQTKVCANISDPPNTQPTYIFISQHFLDISIVMILLAALWPWRRLSL